MENKSISEDNENADLIQVKKVRNLKKSFLYDLIKIIFHMCIKWIALSEEEIRFCR